MVGMIKKIALRVGMGLAALVLALLLGELLVRLVRPQATFSSITYPWTFPCFTANEYSWRILIPNVTCALHSNIGAFPDIVVHTNSLGMRNPEVVIPKPAGTIRILFIGDSFTFGWGVQEEQSHPYIVSEILKDRFPDKKIEVINGGVPATGPAFYYLFLKNIGIKLQPDYIVVGFYPFSDVLYDAGTSVWENLDTNGLPQKIESATSYTDTVGHTIRFKNLPMKFKIPFLRDSALFVLLMDTFWPNAAPADGTIPDPNAWCFFKADCKDIDYTKIKSQKILLGIQSLAQANNAQTLVDIFPVEFQINPHTRPKYGYNIPLLPWDRTYPQDYWKSFLSGEEIASVDIYPKFLTHATEGLYFKLDDHPTPLGQRLAAETIADSLTSMIASASAGK